MVSYSKVVAHGREAPFPDWSPPLRDRRLKANSYPWKMLKKLFPSIILVGAFALWVSPAQAMLVTMLDVNVGGTVYTTKFFDFDVNRSFNDVWDTSGNGVFGDGEAIGPAFDKTPTFWNDPSGAESARDAIIAALGTQDWVDVSAGFNSDAFIIPSRGPFSFQYYRYADSQALVGLEAPVSNAVGVADTQFESLSWVTFAAQSVPEPATPALLLSGVFAGWAARRRRTGRV